MTPSLCIVQPALNVASETFIRAHAERLPAKITVVHDLKNPRIADRPVLSASFAARNYRNIVRRVRRKPWGWERTAAFVQAFQRSRAQAVLAEYGQSGVAIMEACRVAGIPYIVHFHGFDASKQAVLARHAETYPEMLRRAGAIIAVSAEMEARLLGLGAPRETLFVNAYGVDCERFAAADPASADASFLAVGRFTEKKAPHLTLLALAKCLEVCPEARLVMIGDGPLLGPCQDLAQAMNIAPSVTFLGAQSHEDVAREMQRARAFVQHSVTATSGDCEGTPVAVLEAGASGLPVIATRHAGITDVIDESGTGFLVAERDVAGMANQMVELARQPELAAQLGAAARARIEAQYSMDYRIGRLWSIIEGCIKQRNPGEIHAELERELENRRCPDLAFEK